jgi:8-oxo-dGTP pyrophosphatase MutT (NUDIX family)
MNKKIYFNDKSISFSINESQASHNQTIKIINTTKFEKLNNIIKTFLDVNNSESICLSGLNFDDVFNFFKNNFYYIEAAGGVIEKNNKILCIKRLGKWDLPKGKVEKKEKIPLAAVRECEEECGIKELGIIKKLLPTFHLYKLNGEFVLKITHWFLMTAPGKQKLKAQKEEGITKVKWFKNIDIHQPLKNTYPSIREIFSHIQTP